MKHAKLLEVCDQNGHREKYDLFIEYYLNILEERTQKAFPEFFEKLQLKKGQKVLEVGFGGRNLHFYPDHIHLKDIEITHRMLETAKRNADRLKRTNIEYAIYNGHEIPFGENKFDVVLETFALCSAERPEKLSEEMVRVCKRGGRIGIFDNMKASSNSLILKDQLLLAETMKRVGIYHNGQPVVVFDPLFDLDKLIENSVRKYGLKIIDQLRIENSFIECLGRYVLQK